MPGGWRGADDAECSVNLRDSQLQDRSAWTDGSAGGDIFRPLCYLDVSGEFAATSMVRPVLAPAVRPADGEAAGGTRGGRIEECSKPCRCSFASTHRCPGRSLSWPGRGGAPTSC